MPDTGGAIHLAIRGGTVIDGSGAAAFAADVAISADRIVAVGEVAGEARRTIDAAGLVVAPGFIDVHTHDDAVLLQQPHADFKVMQGVTTDIVGNCGAGVAPVSDDYPGFYNAFIGGLLGAVDSFEWRTTGEYYDRLQRAGLSINVASFVPHGVLRFAAMGLENRPPSAEEMARMKELLSEGMAAGAIGLSTGLIYPPGSFARTEELIELSRVVGRYGGIYASHIRDEGAGLLGAVEEAIRIGEEAGVPVEISHHKAGMPSVWGKVKESLALIDRARERGVDVTLDVYPYTAASTSLAVLAQVGETDAVSPDQVLVASVNHQKQYEGKTLQEVAQLKGKPLQEAVEELLEEEEGSVVAVIFIMCEEDVQRVMSHPSCMIGSDGLPSGGKPHPRLYGTFPRVLGRYVREEKVLGLEDAVRKMTDLPARRHHLDGRGRVATGYFADLTLFHPAVVADTATYEDPRRYPEGIPYVIVNGRVVVDGGRHTGAPAGRVLRATTD
jgi:N-acyl-D-amino-acid deacylase